MVQKESEVRRQIMSKDRTIQPEDVAEIVVEGLRSERFLILTHPEIYQYMQKKTDNIDRWIGGMRKLHAGVDL